MHLLRWAAQMTFWEDFKRYPIPASIMEKVSTALSWLQHHKESRASGPYCSLRCSLPAHTCNLPSYLPLIHTRSPLPLPSLGCRVQSAPAAETLTCPGSRATPLSRSSCRNQASSVGKSALSLSPAWYQYPLARGICVCPWAGERPWWLINTCFWGPMQCLAALEGLSNRSW